MDHDHIASHQIVERYVTGRLSDDEAATFEEHMIECRECQEDVSLANDLKLGLEHAASAGEWKRSAEGGLAAWLWKAFASPAPVWALAGVLITLLPAWLLLRSLDQRNVELSKEMAELKSRPATLAAPSAASVPILSLSLSRGVGDGKQPIPQIRIEPGQPVVVLALEYIHDPAVKSYRATIQKADHSPLAAVASLSAISADTIGVQVQSRILMPGRYSVVLAGVNTSGRAAPLGRFDFEVAP